MSNSGKLTSFILFALAALIAYFVILSATPSDAQTGNNNCPDAQKVNTTSGNGNKQSPVFNITGTSMRLKVDSTATSQDPQDASISVFVYPEGETVGSVAHFDVEEGRDDSSIVNAGPGRFYLDILAANVDYTVTVEDCTGTSSNNQDQSTPANQEQSTPANQNNQPVQNVRPENRQRARNVDPRSVPRRRLPPSGGLPVYLVVTSSILAGTGLLALGIVVRSKARR